MLLGNVVDQLLDQDGLADTGAAEETDLTALEIGTDQVYDLDTGLQNLSGALLFLKSRGRTVDRPFFGGVHRGAVVHRVAENIEHPSQGLLTHRYRDGSAGIHGRGAADQAICGAHGDAAHHIVAEMLRHLRHNRARRCLNADRVEQLRQMPIGKTDIQHRPVDGGHCTDILLAHLSNLLLYRINWIVVIVGRFYRSASNPEEISVISWVMAP